MPPGSGLVVGQGSGFSLPSVFRRHLACDLAALRGRTLIELDRWPQTFPRV